MPLPIRRSPQLAPLSREHHEGLLAVWKIRQGVKHGAGHKRIAAYITWFWENELAQHFKKEENIVAPHLPANHSLVAKLFCDHEEVEALIHVTAMIPDEDIFIQLTDGLEAHIRFEERELFPFVETHLSNDILDTLQFQLEGKRPLKKWTDEFWIPIK